jgi:hypothetical protein
MKRSVRALFPLLLLGGCVAMWGQAFNIRDNSPDAITIQYDANFTTPKAMQKLAQEHCARYGKKASLKSDSRNLVHIDTAIYECR